MGKTVPKDAVTVSCAVFHLFVSFFISAYFLISTDLYYTTDNTLWNCCLVFMVDAKRLFTALQISGLDMRVLQLGSYTIVLGAWLEVQEPLLHASFMYYCEGIWRGCQWLLTKPLSISLKSNGLLLNSAYWRRNLFISLHPIFNPDDSQFEKTSDCPEAHCLSYRDLWL